MLEGRQPSSSKAGMLGALDPFLFHQGPAAVLCVLPAWLNRVMFGRCQGSWHLCGSVLVSEKPREEVRGGLGRGVCDSSRGPSVLEKKERNWSHLAGKKPRTPQCQKQLSRNSCTKCCRAMCLGAATCAAGPAA